MPKPSNEMKAIDPGDRRIANIYTAPLKTLMSTVRRMAKCCSWIPTGRLAPAFTCTA